MAWVRRRWRRPRQQRQLLALVTFRDEMRYLPGLFENLTGQVDGVIALDDRSQDGSGEFVAGQPLLRELLTVRPDEGRWMEDHLNHRPLIEAAWAHGSGWLLGIDADERVEEGFRRRAEAEIERAERDGHRAMWVPFRELWDRPDRMRVDGVWGRKRKACLFRSTRDHVFDDRALHAMWAPPVPPGDWPQADLLLYHLRMIDPEERRRRAERYERLDPDHMWQAIGYNYLVDESDIELQPLPGQRAYRPLGR